MKCALAAIKYIATGVTVLLISESAHALTNGYHGQTGVVSRVVDGDTVWVQIGTHEKPLKVRLQGIDAPEICQPGGGQAQRALKNRILGQTVTVTSSALDEYGRTVGTLHMQGEDVARWIVSNGYAWVYSFRQKKGPYASEFAAAQMTQRGLFADAQAMEPKKFRRIHGLCQTSAYRPTK